MVDAPEMPGDHIIKSMPRPPSPDEIAMAALTGLCARGDLSPDAVSGIIWKSIVPQYILEAEQYWNDVRRTGSLAPMLSPLFFASETSV